MTNKLQRLLQVTSFSDPYTSQILQVGDGNSICGTIVSDAAVTVTIYQGPDKTHWPVSNSFITSGVDTDGSGDSFDIKVIDLYAKIELTGTPTVFVASVNLARGSV